MSESQNYTGLRAIGGVPVGTGLAADEVGGPADILLIVAKYDPLFEFLCRAADGPVSVTFDEVERLVGPLPASAMKSKQWWGNEATGGRHVHAKAWLNAGRHVERVDLSGRVVSFSAARWRRGS